MKLTWGTRTHVGHVRDTNEDAVLADYPVFLVADGMGGHAGGERASAIAAASFAALRGAAADPSSVLATLTHANEAIVAEAAASGLLGMGTTVSGIAVVRVGAGREEVLAFNLGDSRLYRGTDGRLKRISVDHTAVQELVDLGLLDVASAANHPKRHVLTRALGRLPAAPADVWFLRPRPGERFVMCTDGVTGHLDDADLAAISAAAPDAQEAADAMVLAALRRGGSDNLTVVVVDVLATGADRSGAGHAPQPADRLWAPDPLP